MRLVSATQQLPGPPLYGLVRDENGNPVIDSPETLPVDIITLMTKSEREAYGFWSGAFAIDAQGSKRLEDQGDLTFLAVDGLVAVKRLWVGTTHYVLTERIDVAAGLTFKLELC